MTEKLSKFGQNVRKYKPVKLLPVSFNTITIGTNGRNVSARKNSFRMKDQNNEDRIKIVTKENVNNNCHSK